MQKDKDELVCGVLDIYGFEIFMVSCCVLFSYCEWSFLARDIKGGKGVTPSIKSKLASYSFPNHSMHVYDMQ